MRKKTYIPLLLVLLVLTASCSASASGSGDSGIEGYAHIGPMCPVAREGEECPDAPYQAAFSVFDASGREVSTFESDEEGYFKVDLAPGTYTVQAEPTRGITHAEPQEVIIEEGGYTSVEMLFDSGIR